VVDRRGRRGRDQHAGRSFRSRRAGLLLDEGAAGKLLERGVADIAGVEAYSAISELLRLAQFASDRWTELTG
jgi:hypothetical protein